MVDLMFDHFRDRALKELVALPRLREIDWRIDIKSASDGAARISVPTVIVQLAVEDAKKDDGKDNKLVRSLSP